MAYDPEYHRRYRELHGDRIREHKRAAYTASREKVKARSRVWATENHDRKLATGKVYRTRTAERRRAYMRERYHRDPQKHVGAMSAWRKANPEKAKQQYLRHEYGLSLAEYDAMVAAQGEACAICRRRTALHVDHDHVTGTVRGLLCDRCNHGLGHFKDNPESLRRAAHYLESKEPSTCQA